MSKIERYIPGSFCWAELGTTDTNSAKAFYQAMFAWDIEEHSFPGGVYYIYQSGGNDAAAMTVAPPGVPPYWLVYFSVVNVDESAAKIPTLGGKIVIGPFDALDKGRMVIAQDPHGAVFALWQAKSHIGIAHGGPLNNVSWPELATPDPVTSAAFYGSLLGWTTAPASDFESARYVEWVNGCAHIGGLLPMRGPQWEGVLPYWTMYVTVADCDERTATAKELGGKICMPPTDIPNTGRFAALQDPQGAMFCIIQMSPR